MDQVQVVTVDFQFWLLVIFCDLFEHIERWQGRQLKVSGLC